MNTRWWMHPGLWMAAGALAYPVGTAVARMLDHWATGKEHYAFGA